MAPPLLGGGARFAGGERVTHSFAIDATYAVALYGALALALSAVGGALWRCLRSGTRARGLTTAELAWSVIPLALLVCLLAVFAPAHHG